MTRAKRGTVDAEGEAAHQQLQRHGRPGGQATAAKHGSEHMATIGRKGGHLGGTHTVERRGPDYMREIAARGGRANAGKPRAKRKKTTTAK